MSTAVVADFDRGGSEPGPVRLRLVAPLAPDRVGRGAFTMMTVGVLAVGLLAILVVNTMVAQGGFSLVELRAEQSALSERRQALEESIAVAAAPASLEAKARELGMVRMKSPAFLRASDGKVIGKTTQAKARKSAGSRAGSDSSRTSSTQPDPA